MIRFTNTLWLRYSFYEEYSEDFISRTDLTMKAALIGNEMAKRCIKLQQSISLIGFMVF